MIKAIFFDIDGTLVPFGMERIPENTLKTLKALREKGIKLFVGTGRPPCAIDHVKALFDFDGYLTANGQYCFDHKGHVIFEQYIPESSVKRLLPYVEENKIATLYATVESCYRNDYVVEDYDLRWPKADDTTANKSILQVMATIEPSQDEDFVNHLPGTKALRWTDSFADVISQSGGKDVGINHMISYYGIELENVMAIGDGANDIPMLEYVPYSVAMGNASKEVKKYASYVTDESQNDGITKACQHFQIL